MEFNRKYQWNLLRQDVDNINKIKNHTKDQLLYVLNKKNWFLLHQDPTNIKNIVKPSNKQIHYVLSKNPFCIEYIPNDHRFYKFALLAYELNKNVLPLIIEKNNQSVLYSLCMKYPFLIVELQQYMNAETFKRVCRIKFIALYFDCAVLPQNISCFERAQKLFSDNSLSNKQIIKKYIQSSKTVFKNFDLEDYTLDMCKYGVKYHSSIYNKRTFPKTLREAKRLLFTCDVTHSKASPNKFFSMLKTFNLEVFLDVVSTGVYVNNPNFKLNHLSDEILLEVLGKNGEWAYMLSADRMTKELWIKVIETYPWAYNRNNVPRDYDTSLAAVSASSYLLKFVPEEFYDHKLMVAAGKSKNIMDKLRHIELVPEKYLDYEICEAFASTASSGYHCKILENIPDDILDIELCKKCVVSNVYDIVNVPQRFLTDEFIDWAISINGEALMLLYQEGRCKLSIARVDLANKTCKYFVHRLPQEYQTYTGWYNFISSGGSMHECPDKYKDDDMFIAGLKYRSYTIKRYKEKLEDIEFVKKAIALDAKHILRVPLPLCMNLKDERYRLLVECASKDKAIFTYIFKETKMIDEYLYFVSFVNRTLCLGCLDYNRSNDHKCIMYLTKKEVTKLKKNRRTPFFKNIPKYRKLAYLVYARRNNLKCEDEFLNKFIQLPTDIMKIIIFRNELVREECLTLLTSNMKC